MNFPRISPTGQKIVPPQRTAGGDGEVVSFKPGVFYFRTALRDAPTREDAIEIGMIVIRELERTRDWLHEQGLPVPKWEVHPAEAHAKGWFGAKSGTRVVPGDLHKRRKAPPVQAGRISEDDASA